MKDVFNIGDQKTFSRKVEATDTAEFDSGEVHAVYATFALGRDAEWCCRLFVLEMKEEDEEGIGTFLTVIHHSPAMVGDTVDFTAELSELTGNKTICSFEAHCGDRLIATGSTGQKILKKEKITALFESVS